MIGTEWVFGSLSQLLLACAALVVAEAVYVLLGFGAGLIAVGTLALVLPELRDAVVVLLLVNLPIELSVVRSARRDIQWRSVVTLFAAVAFGIPAGAWALRFAEPRLLLVALGLLLVVVGTLFAIRPGSRRWTAPRGIELPVGLVSGILTGLFGTGGPPLVLYYQLRGVPKAVFRGNLMAVFLLMTAVRVPSYAALGLITMPRLWSALVLMPAVALGALIGQRVHLRLDEGQFRRIVSIALVVIGLLLLAPGS